jgi:hypothetical protein
MIRLEHGALKFLVVISLLGAPACDDDSGSDDTDSGKKDAGDEEETDSGGEEEEDAGAAKDSGAMDTGSTTADTGAADAGKADTSVDSGPAPSCTEYCTKIAANCTADAGQLQYASTAVCMAVCTSFPAGTAADTAGNTLGCRVYHAGAAASDAVTHCNHAGITGGDKDPTDSAGGPCGEGCEAFCNEAAVACTTATSPMGMAPWATKDACMTECKTFPASTTTFTSGATGDNFNCRAYHLTAASTLPDPHCGHIKKVSATCK